MQISEENKCFGGVARLKKTVDDLKTENGNVVFVNAGDFYQGTVWYTSFKWNVVAQFANLLNFDAMVNMLLTLSNPFSFKNINHKFKTIFVESWEP